MFQCYSIILPVSHSTFSIFFFLRAVANHKGLPHWTAEKDANLCLFFSLQSLLGHGAHLRLLGYDYMAQTLDIYCLAREEDDGQHVGQQPGCTSC